MATKAEKVRIENLDAASSLGTAEGIEAAWIEEARLRLNEYDAGRVTPVQWHEARVRIFHRES